MKNPHEQLSQNNYFFSLRYLSYLFFLICILFFHTGLSLAEDSDSKLDAVRKQIRNMESEIQINQDKYSQLQQELRTNELAAGEIALNIHHIEQQQIESRDQLERLNNKKILIEHKLVIQREKLARQIRASYMTGRADYLKLILNQQDPAKIGRVLAYYEYHNRTKIKQIESLENNLNDLDQIEKSIGLENNELEKLKAVHLKQKIEIHEYRLSRQSILSELKKHLDSQGQQLQILRGQENEILGLIEDLDHKKDPNFALVDVPDFTTLKGKLNWPVEGNLLNRFGNRKNKTSLLWQGVKIKAPAGSNVRAISAGRVIFADWFKNLGLLLILDHGDGYMSLYGHNQSLLKKPGDWVLDNEIIAHSGDSGGQDTPGVYLEIRHKGTPLNPVRWCKK